MIHRASLFLGVSALLGSACGGSQPAQETTEVATAPPPRPAPVQTAEPAPPPEPPEPPATPAELTYAEGFATPESVLYDPDADVYLVSNINGTPFEKDDNGYIMRLSPDGTVAEAKWIDGADNDKVELNAPKGMAIANGKLYVADIDVVRVFNARNGRPQKSIPIEGATFLNDVAVGPRGKIYVSDSGLKPGEGGFAPSGTDAIHVIERNGKAKPFIAGEELGRPNGLFVTDEGVTVATFGDTGLYVVKDGEQGEATKLPGGSLDGLVRLADGTWLVSSWEASSIFHGTPKDGFKAIVVGAKSPADIGFDTKRNRILVPQFTEDRVAVYALPGGAEDAEAESDEGAAKAE